MAIESEEDMVKWMNVALARANESLAIGEVPVGCLFVHNEQVLASGSNTVNETRNATRHAEINCIDAVLDYCREKSLDHKRVFSEIDVVVTVEPCVMCAAALNQLRVRSIIYGCRNDRFGGCTSVLEAIKFDDFDVKLTGGVRADEAMQLLKKFYKGTNPNAPESKVKRSKT